MSTKSEKLAIVEKHLQSSEMLLELAELIGNKKTTKKARQIGEQATKDISKLSQRHE